MKRVPKSTLVLLFQALFLYGIAMKYNQNYTKNVRARSTTSGLYGLDIRTLERECLVSAGVEATFRISRAQTQEGSGNVALFSDVSDMQVQIRPRHSSPLAARTKNTATIASSGLPDALEVFWQRHSSKGKEPPSTPFLISLLWSPCSYGGERPWFACPGCARRCAVLYLENPLRCRLCLQVRYPCQTETELVRYQRHLRKTLLRIQKVFGYEGTMTDFSPDRPPRMRLDTYYSLEEQHQVFVHRLSSLEHAREGANARALLAKFKALESQERSENYWKY